MLRKNNAVAKVFVTIVLLIILVGFSVYAVQSNFNSEPAKAVYGQSYVPVPGAYVYASGVNGTGYSTADSQGNYDITTYLGTGNYTLIASAPGYLDQQVDNISVTSGSETTGVNIYLSLSGGISGTVTDASTGAPLSDVLVTALNATGSNSESAFTDANGNYQIIQDLPTGTYNVTVEYATGYLETSLSDVSVTAGVMTSNVNLALSASGVITGTVTSNTGTALSGISVEVESANALYAGFGTTNAAGVYTINTNLPTGTYNLTEDFPTGYLTNTISGIAVTAGKTTTQNVQLSPSGVISGTVTSTTGQPLSDVSIFVSSTTGGSGFATTDASGNYQVNTDLTTGSYTVEAFYGSQFQTYPSSVSVTAGQTASGIDFTFTVTPTGTVTGTVTSSTGGPVIDAYVTAQSLTGSGSNYTDSNGDYIISGLSAGTYNITVTATGYTSGQQTGITVTVGQTTSTVNFVLTPIPSGSISGQVLAQQASPFPTPTPTPTITPPPTSPTPAPTASATATPAPTTTAAPTASPAPTAVPTATPIPTLAPTPTPTPITGTITATTSSGAKVSFPIKGNLTSSEISGATFTTSQSSATTTLAFAVGGTSGNVGFLNITMAKSEVQYGTIPSVFINNVIASSQGNTQDSSNYYVWFTTALPQHQVSVVFSTTSPTPTPTPKPTATPKPTSIPQGYIYGLVVVVVVIIIIAAVLALRSRRHTTQPRQTQQQSK